MLIAHGYVLYINSQHKSVLHNCYIILVSKVLYKIIVLYSLQNSLQNCYAFQNVLQDDCLVVIHLYVFFRTVKFQNTFQNCCT